MRERRKETVDGMPSGLDKKGKKKQNWLKLGI